VQLAAEGRVHAQAQAPLAFLRAEADEAAKGKYVGILQVALPLVSIAGPERDARNGNVATYLKAGGRKGKGTRVEKLRRLVEV
jgi:hypothetical protein